MTSEFVLFSSNRSLNHIKIEKCLLLLATNTNIFTLLFKELKTDGKSFIFAVCRLTYDHVTSNLISLLIPCRVFITLVTLVIFIKPIVFLNAMIMGMNVLSGNLIILLIIHLYWLPAYSSGRQRHLHSAISSKNVFEYKWTLFLSPKIPIWISPKFQRRIEQNFSEFPIL